MAHAVISVIISLIQGVASLIIGIRGHIVGNFSVACAHIDLVALYIWLIILSHL
ncbi:hypothetical protein JB92DRAFT_2901959 [Gautieria morchelliformis]|nr:hypothetical protein JB92DRAFT_2901959 [Gautieria morchelliformis]